MRFSTNQAEIIFISVSKIFSKATIFYYFNLNYYILIKLNKSGYNIRRIFSAINFD